MLQIAHKSVANETVVGNPRNPSMPLLEEKVRGRPSLKISEHHLGRIPEEGRSPGFTFFKFRRIYERSFLYDHSSWSHYMGFREQ
jgi:hypothetical protein